MCLTDSPAHPGNLYPPLLLFVIAVTLSDSVPRMRSSCCKPESMTEKKQIEHEL